MSENSWLPALLADLRSRGVTFTMKGNALKIRPWKTLTKDEASTVQANRAALKDLVRTEEVATPPAATPKPPPAEPCCYCHRAPCIGPKHSAYSVLHWNHPGEVERRRVEATAVMMKMLPFGNPY